MSEAQEMTATIRRIAARARRSPDVRELLGAARQRLAGTPQRRERLKKALLIGGPLLVLALGLAAFFWLRPIPTPDYRKARLDKLFDYTLLTDEFNRLPVEKRLELIGQLVQRLQGMSAGDSALLGAFAAGIAGSARQQIEENLSRLAIDMWDKYARDYGSVPSTDRAAYLDRTFLDFVKTMEAMAGQTRNVSDAERLAEVRRQADRDKDALRSGKGAPPPQALARIYTFMHGNVSSHANAGQITRGQLMMRDMMRHFRGQDLETGKNR
jgi:hypothetical protein